MPLAIYMLDDNRQVVLINITEEESKEQETFADAKVKFFDSTSSFSTSKFLKQLKKVDFCLKLYSQFYKNISLPPPEI